MAAPRYLTFPQGKIHHEPQIFLLVMLQTALIIALVWALIFLGKDEYEAYTRPPEPAVPVQASVEEGAAVVNMSLKSQQQSGIATVELEEVKFRPALAAFGTVVGIEPLLELRARYLAARGEIDVIRAALTRSQRDYQRQAELNRDDGNVSDRAVEAAQAQAAGDAARLRAAEASALNLRDMLLQQWSEPLATWASEPQAPDPLQSLIERREVLLSVTLPDTAPAPDGSAMVEVAPVGTAAKPQRARYVGPAAKSDGAFPGRSHFFRAPVAEFRTDMRLTVSLQGREATQEGVVVPANAVVWFAGKAWVYEQEEDNKEEFVRRQIPTENEVGAGWFVAGRFEAGDRVVVEGAQLLLSEEMKNQITNENND